MSFHVTHRYGAVAQAPAEADFPALLRELHDDPADVEHGDVSLTHESQWCLSASRDGALTWENLEQGEPRHMRQVAEGEIVKLWSLLARGDIAAVEAEAWLPGYP